jgi:hypothetical protein
VFKGREEQRHKARRRKAGENVIPEKQLVPKLMIPLRS